MKPYNFMGIFLAMAISTFPPVHAATRNSEIAVVLHAGAESLDVYLVNQTDNDRTIYSALDYRGVEREIEFHFHDANGLCKACAYRADVDMSSRRVPPNPLVKVLRPTEIYGARFRIKGIAGRYGLKPGCYGVYATYKVKDPPSGAFEGSINSNAVKLCLK